VWWQLLAAALGAAALGSAVAASRYIVRPLRCLQRAATALQAGDGSTRCALTGPSEVRVAALALRDAAAHVELVARQADALASGDLDADVLDEPAPGGLGTALQQAVHNLRSALAQQEEFRRRLTHEASHDALTHLPNRNAALAQLARSLAHQRRTASQLAVLVVDIDRFNEVNDHHGHRGGDTVLSTIARRLVTTVRESDHVGRLGGDEFVVVAEPVSGPEEAMQLAERILAAIAEPIHLPHSSVRVQASVGIAVADSRLTADELIRDADLAVSRAKERGEGGIEVCNADLHAEIAEVAGMQVALRNAIDRDELVVHYQPIIDVHTARLHALEALVRWRRPGQAGLVPPDRFITIAERSSLVIDLDRWVVHAVARQLAEWADDPVLGTVPVAVNVSGRHLAHDHVVEQLLQPLAEVGVAPRRLVVEVTESALMGDLVRASTKLHRLRSAGMRIAIDDFGTGYTSLAHLRCLPVDVLKIDRSFSLNAVGSEHGASIVKLIIDAGHLLGATVTAEGIETEEEAARLTELGADHLQGFLYSRPLPPDDLAALHRHVAHLRG
jgi:diguanylate cyclase (GGDEF)-like protein